MVGWMDWAMLLLIVIIFVAVCVIGLGALKLIVGAL